MLTDCHGCLQRCQEIWGELGLNAEDQAGKFRDINALLLKKCSEELEGLEAAREKLQARINAAYEGVKRLEDVMQVEEPIDLKLLHSTAGKTLLAQEKYLLTAQKSLEGELCQRFRARGRGLSKIRDLVDGMELTSLQELRHASLENTNVDFSRTLQMLADLEAWGGLEQANAASLASLLTTAQHMSVTVASLKHDEELMGVLLKEKAKRLAEAEGSLQGIRSVLQQMKFSPDDTMHVLRRAVTVPSGGGTVQISDSRLENVEIWLAQKGGNVDVSNSVLGFLSTVQRIVGEIYDGRSNAISYLYSTLDEATEVMRAILGNADHLGDSQALETERTPSSRGKSAFGCDRHELIVGKRRFEELGGPIEGSLRALLLSLNDEFMAFGIETDAQRISFFLGSGDDENNATRKILERYLVGSSDGADVFPHAVDAHSKKTSFLSNLDPAFGEFGAVYSATQGSLLLERLRSSVQDVSMVQRTLESAQKRLDSLKKIMKLFNEISEFKKKIGQFEANASQKDRLFGSSLRLLEEEKFRKMAAKRYPNLLAALRKEVDKWLQNEEGEFDLSVLGKDLKHLLLDMMNTDTGLMHLDLGVVDATRTATRRQPKTSLTPTPGTGTAMAASSQNASAPARSRSMTVLTRESSSKKRLTFDG